MSRTYKDKPWKYKNPEAYDWRWGHEKVPYLSTYKNYLGQYVEHTKYMYIPIRGIKTKKPRYQDTDWHWYESTPSWWTRLTMNRPARRYYHLLEHEAERLEQADLEDFDFPDLKKKPHNYYY